MYDPTDGSDGGDDYTTSTAFLLWLACVFGVCGVHRFYLGKPLSGLLYVFTFGLFGIGQLVDLFKMRDMVLLENTKAKQLRAAPQYPLLAAHAPAPAAPEVDPDEMLRMTLVHAAARYGGALSVSQGVMASGKSFQEIEAMLDNMAKSGYVGIDNDPETGAVVYTFGQLS